LSLDREVSGVSPVIGSVLILVIMIIAIGGILLWGVPAIQGVQEFAQFQSVQTQMLELNQDLRNLRDPLNTRVATISIAQGDIQVAKGDRWVISVSTDASLTSFAITSFSDDDDSLGVSGLPGTYTLTLDKVVGGRFTALDSCNNPCSTLNIGAGDITKDVLRVQLKVSSLVKAESWIMNMGRITYDQGNGNKNHLEFGASLIGQQSSVYLKQSPAVKPPDFTSDPQDKDFFLRVIQLVGSDRVGGQGQFSVQVNLVDNYGVSRGRPSMGDARLVRFQVAGDLSESFCNYFSNLKDFTFAGTGSCATDAQALYNPAQSFSFEMSHAVVNAYVRAS
jgi:hypothetical protein